MSQQPGWRAGETSISFEEYAAARQAGLIRFGYLLVRDHQLAQDLAQEGLARLHGRWSELAAESNPDAYVRKVMVNQLLSWRRRRSWSERPVAEVHDRGETDPTAAIGDREAMWKLIGDLPLRQRAVVVLRYYEDLDDAAIGRILGCTASTVATHATRALDRLRMVVDLADAVSPGPS
ncbi:MAG: SigE family RNA polymerase sigma factor [Frankiaceae bacterium]|nr:SigE family RNA polymerase sigma factor [Frankiaceae bacterium]MBV9871224.1 SigE family RNA polymerase sigma factor [Frankiaceae bacterium]